MNKNLQEKLFKDFPEIFERRHLSKQETAMCYGITCGDGWYSLIYNLCSLIKNHVDYNKLELVQVDQVKTKWNGLRFYTHTKVTPEIRAMISTTENMSRHICQNCGISIFNLKDHDCRRFDARKD